MACRFFFSPFDLTQESGYNREKEIKKEDADAQFQEPFAQRHH